MIQPTRSWVDDHGNMVNWPYNHTDFVLDSFFPYPYENSDTFVALPNGTFLPGWYVDSYKAPQPGGPPFAYMNHTTSDSPYMLLFDNLAQPDQNGYYPLYNSVSMHDTFTVYQMYLPPNTMNVDVQWVPLKVMTWGTSGDETSADVIYDQFQNLITHILAGSTITLISAPADTDGHPIWSANVTSAPTP